MKTVQSQDDMNLLRQGFSYAHRYRDAVFVVKIDCTVIDHPQFPLLIKDIALLQQLGINVVLVPGARERIDEIISRYGFTTEYHRSIRITTEETIPFARMAAFDVSNRLMTGLAGQEVNAVVGNWVRAKSLGVIDGIDFHYSGTVERILTDPVREVISMGMIPIFPCIGWNSTGKPYNLSSDELVLQIAVALGAEKLFFITTEAQLSAEHYHCPAECGVSRDGRISRIDASTAAHFLELNPEKSGELFRINLARRACDRGISRVHILDGRREGVLLQEIFSNQGVGTMVHTNLYESIRDMRASDVSDVLRIMDPYVEEGILVPRDKQTLQQFYHDFIVFDVDGIVHGCAALHIYEDDQAEIAAVAVNRKYHGTGIGGRLVSFLIERARNRGLRQLFVLTTRTADWFEQQGFRRASLDEIPVRKRQQYNCERNSSVLVYLLDENADAALR
jgi:amino-acid N-acetyltransferase